MREVRQIFSFTIFGIRIGLLLRMPDVPETPGIAGDGTEEG